MTRCPLTHQTPGDGGLNQGFLQSMPTNEVCYNPAFEVSTDRHEHSPLDELSAMIVHSRQITVM